jgi:hypothetical protein
MKHFALSIALAVFAFGLFIQGAEAAKWTSGMNEGKPEFKSMGPMTFGPVGILFVADAKAAAITAIATGDAKPAALCEAIARFYEGAGGGEAQSSAAHDREFWRSIVQRNYAVPEGESAFALARELSGLLGSPDPELRDNLAYVILGAWIVDQGKFAQPELLSLLDEWRANLRSGLGESGTDSVLKRSFSALCLASLAEYDLKSPFLGASRYRALLSDALAYIKEERDIRGYDENKGWI